MATSTDFGAAMRQQLIQNAVTGPVTAPLVEQADQDRLFERLMARVEKAKQYLGERYVMHPNYKFHPHHRPSHKTSAVLAMTAQVAISAGRI
jgi:hypothetical protein